MITTKQFSGKKKLLIQAIIVLIGLFIFASWVTKILFVERFYSERRIKKEDASMPQKTPDDPAVTEGVESFLRMKYAPIPSEDLPWWDDPQLGSCTNSATQDTVLKVD